MMAMRESDRMRSVQTPIIPIIGRLIAETPGTISLGQGIVAYGPPPEAMTRLASFGLDVEDHRYGPVEGRPELVDALEAKLAADNAVRVRPASRVVVTAGANMGFMNAVLAVADPGDEILLQAPFYFNHEMAIQMAGCRAVAVPTDESYQLRPHVIRAAITPRTRAVVTISPNNPSGVVYPEAALREVSALCRERGVYHVHDEAYEYFTYDGARHFSPGSIDGAAGHTVGAGYCRGHLAGLADVRARVLEALGHLDGVCEVPTPDGAFYCLLRVHTRIDSYALAERLIREHRVAVIPGAAFGMTGGCYLRVSYGALEAGTVMEGTGRLVDGLRAIVGVSRAG